MTKPLTSRRGTPGNGLFTKPQQTPALAQQDAATQQKPAAPKRREREI
jgi:hypothetical protein